MQIEKVNVTNQVVEYIRNNIENSTWKIGEKIPSENQMCEELGVSRVSIRAAIRHFVGLGVLESFHGKGTFLMNTNVDPTSNDAKHFIAQDSQELKKVLEFRVIVETQACALATENLTEETLETLKECVNTMVENVGEQDKFVEADIEFHKQICNASNNPFIAKCMDMLYTENKDAFLEMNARFGYKDGIYYHTIILAAIESKNAQEAQEIMKEHLEQALNRLELEG